MEILLPRTDAGVFAQAVAGAVVLATALWLVRRDRDFRLLVLGVSTVTVAWFVLRAVH